MVFIVSILEKTMKKFLTILVCVLAFASFGDVLWWMVDDSATVDGRNVHSFVSSYGIWTEVDPDSGEEFSGYNVGARVKMTFADGRSETLPIVYPDFPGETSDYVEFFDGGGHNASGFGTGEWATSSPFSHEMLAETLFQIQLGELTWNEALNVFDWSTLAESDPVAKSMLSDHIFEGPAWNTPANSQWIPTDFHTIPEPNSGLLILVGFGILCLKRKSYEKRY